MMQQQPGAPDASEMLAGMQPPSTSVEVALARIDEKLAAGERRFDAFDRHVQGCEEEKKKVLVAIAELRTKMFILMGVVVAGFGLLGSVIVASSILLD